MVVKDGVYWWTRKGLVSRDLREDHLVAAMGLRMIVREGVEMVGAERRELLDKQTLDWLNQLSQPEAEMSSTLLEVTRAAHEDVEQLERLIVKDLQNDPPTAKDRLYQSHRVRNNIDTIISTTEKLIEIYEDKDNARKDEIAALGGQTATGINVFSAFYDRLKEIREYHRKHPAARLVNANEDDEALLKEEPVIEFSGEEAFGRYLDLHELFNQYINSKFGSKIEYSAYLDVFSQPHNIPWKLKSTRQYREYMENLLEYLIYFFQRTEPLQDLDRIFSKALASLGLKTGGTVQQRAERLFLTKHTPLEKLDKKHFAKGSLGPRQNGSTAVSQDINSLKHIALMEAKMKKLADLLSKTIEQTKENVVKKQALTYEEMEQEREEFTNPGPKHLVWMAVGRVLNAGACSVEAEFEEQWANGQVQGWEKQGQENEDDPAQHTMIDLDYYSTVEELMEVGPEKLKEVILVLFDYVHHC
ncbi:hypothetical protein GOBAR_AA07680 [Gossypium barbadense]|uniref:SF3A3 domain-containing protein n=1 Tax=Gossypium barbadense TaxID=3634 RepID=A0A2P5YBK6_GOSBA|nr:hypothetical protein GOBAR_AA07680 [Gossypium barbadense]